MENKRAQLTILILENRQMIATILADLLAAAGYQTRVVPQLDQAREAIAEAAPGLVLLDRGVLRPGQEDEWAQLEAHAASLDMPVFTFLCSPTPTEDENALVLRSPVDFAGVVDRIEAEWRKKQPFLGMTLVERGLLRAAELETALRVQRELAKVDRYYPLGELLVRLGIVAPESVEQALSGQE